MEKTTVKDLRHRCKELGLFGYSRKKKAELEQMIEKEENKGKGEYEIRVQEQDPILYRVIRAHVPSIPDIRPQETVRKMKTEEQDKWRMVYEELVALGREGEGEAGGEAKGERALMAAITDDDTAFIQYLLDDLPLLKRFFTVYPSLVHILTVIKKESILPLYIAQGDLSLVDIKLKTRPMYSSNNPQNVVELIEVFDLFPLHNIIRCIRDEETAKRMLEMYPEFDIYPSNLKWIVENNNIGLLYVYFSKVDPAEVAGVVGATFVDATSNLFVRYLIDAIEEAIKRNRFRLVKMLVEKYDAIKLIDKWNFASVEYLVKDAAIVGNLEMLDYLFEKWRVVEEERYMRHSLEDVFRAAIRHGHSDIIKAYKERYDLPIRGEDLSAAIKSGIPEILTLILSYGAKSIHVSNALITAVKVSNKEMVTLLLAEDNVYSKTNDKAVEIAALNNKQDILRLLLSNERLRTYLSNKTLYQYRELIK